MMQVVVVYKYIYWSFFSLLNLFVCFSVVSHIRVTAEDVANVALDWCNDDEKRNRNMNQVKM